MTLDHTFHRLRRNTTAFLKMSIRHTSQQRRKLTVFLEMLIKHTKQQRRKLEKHVTLSTEQRELERLI